MKYFQRKYALSAEGDHYLKTAIGTHTLSQMMNILPIMLSFMFLQQFLGQLLGMPVSFRFGLWHYAAFSIGIFMILVIVGYWDYNACYTKIYHESALRRISLAETLRRLPLAYFGKKDLADLSSTIMADATEVETLFSHAIPQLYASAAAIFIISLGMFLYNWRMTLAMFWVVPVSALVFILSYKGQKHFHKIEYDHYRRLNDRIQEDLDAIQDIKAYNLEQKSADELCGTLDKIEADKLKGELYMGVFINFSSIILKLGMGSVAILGAYWYSLGVVDAFTYIVFLIMSGTIYEPFLNVINNLSLLIYMGNMIQRMRDIDEMPRQTGSTEFSPVNSDIEFDHVWFSYEEDRQTLKDISFTAKQGEITALVGPSGGGKSTAAKLCARFWDIDKGTIRLGGIDISKIDPEVLLKHFSIVFQDVLLFNNSIMENIRIGRKDATDEEVREAARLACCEDFVQRLPEGYQTEIGENGARLSGGERQRISIARALLKDAPIILLDEATASLDAENESRIQEALASLIRNKTVIIIAHRMRTVMDADKIIVLKEGELVESGAPQELLNRGGAFASLCRLTRTDI